MSKHHEPWQCEIRPGRGNVIYDARGKEAASSYKEKRTDRIVTCVNACEGMDEPAAEVARLRSTEQQHRELREAVLSWLALKDLPTSDRRVASADLVRQIHEAECEVKRLAGREL